MSNSNLEFRKIKSLNFLYEVNENGTIFRNVKSKKQNKIIIDYHHSKKGYYATFIHVGGRRHGNKTIRVMMHSIVAECWLGGRPDGYVIDHIDRNTRNNHYSNLRYCTVSENMKNRQLSEKVIAQAKSNCLNYTMTYVAKPVVIIKDDKKLKFPSMSQCAYYLSEEYSKTFEHIRCKLKARRHHIYDYDIIYLNAETGHIGSKEQGTVRSTRIL